MTVHLSKLESVIIPNSVKTIDEGAFQGCTSIVSINIPESVENNRRRGI